MVISVVNQKGGVGKTVTAINIAGYLAHLGKSVLLVDLDPQANATSGLGINPEKPELNIYRSLMDSVSLSNVILTSGRENLWLVPSTPDLAGANVELVNMERREYRLAETLFNIKNYYNYIIVDCPPSLGLLTIDGLVAADLVLIPVQAEYYALEGLSQLLKTIDLVRKNLKPELGILGALLTMYDRRSRLSAEVWQELYKHFPHKIFRTVIPRDVRLAEAPSYGKTILEYAPRSRAARAYQRLAKEVLSLEL